MSRTVSAPEGEKGQFPLSTGSAFHNSNLISKSVGATAQVIQSANLRIYVLTCLVGVAAGLACLISPWLGLVLVLGAIFLVAALSKPIILCYLLVAAIALTSGINRGDSTPLLMPSKILLLVSVGVTLLVTLVRKRRQIGLSGYFGMTLIMLIGGVVFIPIAVYLEQGVELTFGNAFKMATQIQYVLMFWLFANAPESEKDRRRVIALMLVCAGVVAVVGLLQAVGIGFVTGFLDRFYASSHEEMAANAGRVTSLLGAWNSLGIFLMLSFLVGLAILPEIDKPVMRAGTMVLMALSALCLVASGSYAGILGLIMGIPLIQALAKRKMRMVPILVLCSIGIFIAFLLFEPFLQPLVNKRLAYQYRDGGLVPQTFLFRVEVWRDVFLPPILQHLPWAVYPTVPSSYAWQYEESQYILLLFRTGLSGLLGFLGWMALTIGWLNRALRTSTGFTSAMVTATLTLVIVLVIAGLTNEVFSFAGSIDYLWMMLGMIAGSKGALS